VAEHYADIWQAPLNSSETESTLTYF